MNVWVRIVGDHIIGPYFFEENLNAANYLYFLQNDLPDLLRPIGNQVFRIMCFNKTEHLHTKLELSKLI